MPGFGPEQPPSPHPMAQAAMMSQAQFNPLQAFQQHFNPTPQGQMLFPMFPNYGPIQQNQTPYFKT